MSREILALLFFIVHGGANNMTENYYMRNKRVKAQVVKSRILRRTDELFTSVCAFTNSTEKYNAIRAEVKKHKPDYATTYYANTPCILKTKRINKATSLYSFAVLIHKRMRLYN